MLHLLLLMVTLQGGTTICEWHLLQCHDVSAIQNPGFYLMCYYFLKINNMLLVLTKHIAYLILSNEQYLSKGAIYYLVILMPLLEGNNY